MGDFVHDDEVEEIRARWQTRLDAVCVTQSKDASDVGRLLRRIEVDRWMLRAEEPSCQDPIGDTPSGAGDTNAK